MAERDYGTVTYEGKTYTLAEDAYVDSDQDGNAEYHAAAVDEDGNTYRVVWLTTKEWDLAIEHVNLAAQIEQAKRYHDEIDDEDRKRFAELDELCLPDVNDESSACEWSEPYDVVLIETA